MTQEEKIIQIAGAGPAGLAAAITLSKAGYKVQVCEARKNVGQRFGGDLQGLENWTRKQDALQWMEQQGLTSNFEYAACTHGYAYDAYGKAYPLKSREPLFYLLERGPGENTLDHALLNQAQSLGVEVKFNHRLTTMNDQGILAIGPRAADAIAVGYHFDTDADNGFWAICDDNIAPKGYAYLLVLNGHGTIKTCMFTGFKQEQSYVDKTLEAFKKLVGLKMHNLKPHGGVGNFLLPETGVQGSRLIVGEQAGFQDTLFGFGIRYALSSGILAAKSIINGDNYEDLWQKELQPLLKTSVSNRWIYNLLGNRGYRLVLKLLANKNDLRKTLRNHYRSTFFKRLLYPWAQYRYKSKRTDISCHHNDCSCVWCRGGKFE